eukprot:scaffold186198_cov31-Tisochrysis_lutea.AAC.1
MELLLHARSRLKIGHSLGGDVIVVVGATHGRLASMAVVRGVHRGHGPCDATWVACICSASAGGRGRFASDCSIGTGEAPSAGGPKERRRGEARRRAPWQLTKEV